jgi:hypothetical protein
MSYVILRHASGRLVIDVMYPRTMDANVRPEVCVDNVREMVNHVHSVAELLNRVSTTQCAMIQNIDHAGLLYDDAQTKMKASVQNDAHREAGRVKSRKTDHVVDLLNGAQVTKKVSVQSDVLQQLLSAMIRNIDHAGLLNDDGQMKMIVNVQNGVLPEVGRAMIRQTSRVAGHPGVLRADAGTTIRNRVGDL